MNKTLFIITDLYDYNLEEKIKKRKENSKILIK
jgi:hypothetical protein